MIRELGLHVLEEACRQWVAWQVESIDQPSFTLSVNVSPRQLRDPSFVSEVRTHPDPRRAPPVAPHARDHRELHGRGPGERPSAPARAEDPRGAHLDGRLRHRVLVAGVAAGPAARHPEDRQGVRRPHRRGSAAHGVRAGDHPHGQDARARASSPRASRPPSRASGCRASDAASPRASTSRSRFLPTTSSTCSTRRMRRASPAAAGRTARAQDRAPGCGCSTTPRRTCAVRDALRRSRRCGRGCPE